MFSDALTKEPVPGISWDRLKSSEIMFFYLGVYKNGCPERFSGRTKVGTDHLLPALRQRSREVIL